jgi:hypothetical protein
MFKYVPNIHKVIVFLSHGFAPSGGIWPCMETVLVVTTGKGMCFWHVVGRAWECF